MLAFLFLISFSFLLLSKRAPTPLVNDIQNTLSLFLTWWAIVPPQPKVSSSECATTTSILFLFLEVYPIVNIRDVFRDLHRTVPYRTVPYCTVPY